jgi:tetratricopeptide (TPR) repeat protein
MLSCCRKVVVSWRPRGRLGWLLGVLLVLLAACGLVWAKAIRAEYHLHAARSALQRRDYVAAEVHLARHLELRPASTEGHFRLARLLRRLGRVREAADHLHSCRVLGNEPDALNLETALLQVQEGYFTSSTELFLRGRLDNHPDSFLMLEALSQGYTKTYRLRDALACLNRMLEQQPDNVYALLRRGWIVERQGRLDQALEDYRRAVAVDPGHVLARQRLGEHLLVRRKKAAEAGEHFEALRQLAPGDVTAGVYLTQCWLEQGRVEEARRLLDELLSTHPQDAVVLTERAKLALSDRQWGRAEGWLRAAVALQPHGPSAYYQLYLCLMGQGKTAEAEPFRVRFQSLQENLTRLEALLQRAAEAPEDLRLRREIASLFSSLGEEQESQRWLREAMRSGAAPRPAP